MSGGGLDDIGLAAAAQRGDMSAFGQLYDRHVGLALALATRFLGDADAAQDLVHDVFIEAWRRIRRFDPERGSFRSWLVAMLRSRSVDRLRRSPRRREISLEEDATELVALEAPVDPDRQRVRAWLETLPEPSREALVLAYFEGYTMTEIAKHQGCPAGTVKARISRALARLRAELEPSP